MSAMVPWSLAALLYALGVALDWLGSDEMGDTTFAYRIASFAWPFIAALWIVHAIWQRTVGGWLWRRAHRKWCEESTL